MVRSGLAFVCMLAFATIAACATGQIGDAESGNANALSPPLVPASATDAGVTPSANVPSFAVDVEPIIQKSCQNCHRPGGIAPFSLVTYEDVMSHGHEAKLKTAARQMPPWGAFDNPDCKLTHPLKDDLRLTDDEISIIARWVDGGMPLGDASKRPAPRTTFPATSIPGSTAYKLAKPYTVNPGPDDIRCFPVDPGIGKDTWISATNVKPGDPRVVHHVIVYLDNNKSAVAKAGADGSYKCFGGPSLGDGVRPTLLLAWAPGVPPTGLAQTGAAIRIPANAGLVMQVHYHPIGETVTDQSSFEVLPMPEGAKPDYVAQVMLPGNARDAEGSNTDHIVKLLPGADDPPSGPAFLIPSNAKAHKEEMEITAPPITGLADIRIAMAGAHMHWAGVNMTLKTERANPEEGQPKNECLMSTPKYDFNWQRGYAYDEPFEKLPRINVGDKLRLTCTYDNTIANKNVQKAMYEENKKDPFELHLGETTHDEMCLSALVILRKFVPGVDD